MSMNIHMEDAGTQTADGEPLFTLLMTTATDSVPPITATTDSFKQMGQAIYNLASQAEASVR
jgi:hypothetical protein